MFTMSFDEKVCCEITNSTHYDRADVVPLTSVDYRMFSCFLALLSETRGVPPAISRPLMKKHILIAATAALLALPSLSSTVLAAPPKRPRIQQRTIQSFRQRILPLSQMRALQR